ncbi:uncharacterized protein LOC134184756 [Corticium candelabrum]|uniref:uncharacterized protein LOC134184756 n=2 Tax=Corticium candelabrum TaxID=121492 RepID=UPI002E2F79DC|nr:uncharacterized protein LOC134184756 [Corticium candelabrum]
MRNASLRARRIVSMNDRELGSSKSPVQVEEAPPVISAETGTAYQSVTQQEVVLHEASQDQSSDAIDLPAIPQYRVLLPPNFNWGGIPGADIKDQIDQAYREVVHWKRNLFQVPYGSSGGHFVSELTRLFYAFANESDLESVAITAAMLMPHLLLQRPHTRSSVQQNSSCLSRRLETWKKGDIGGLIAEGRTIQSHLRCHSTRNCPQDRECDQSRKVALLLQKGNINAAQRLLSDEDNCGLLELDECIPGSHKSVRDVLKDKHPDPAPMFKEAVLDSKSQAPPTHPILFDKIDGYLIRAMSLKCQGAAGPSGLDAAAWRRLCTGFKVLSRNLCDSIASTTRRIATQFIDPSGISALVACRLIPLDKRPGVRPIGVCETLRRIISKAVLSVVKSDILNVAGPLQLCAGQNVGCEAAIHAIRGIYDEDETEAVLFVDATNAFNTLNRQVALANISVNCPAIFPILANTYRQPSSLFVGGETLLSSEGTTQGDPLAMPMYALATIPLLKSVQTNGTKQVWYADDAAAGGSLDCLHKWWNRLVDLGAMFGYLPNPKKSWLLVKSGNIDKATHLFENTNINITTEGQKYLGAAIGNKDFCNNFLQEKVTNWKLQVERLSCIAQTQPQAAHSIFTRGLIGRWKFALRTNENFAAYLNPLEEALRSKLIPAITNRSTPGDKMRRLFALPPRLGGLGIVDPRSLTCELEYSKLICAPLVNRIVQQETNLDNVPTKQNSMKASIRQQKHLAQKSHSEITVNDLSVELKRSVELACEKGASCWLTAIPLEQHGFTLHKSAFRDALCLRYGWHPSNLPDICPCGSKFSVDHSLSCPTGGYPSIRHNEVRDLFTNLLTEVCHDVHKEPVLQPLNGEVFQKRCTTSDENARLDIAVSGFWGGHFQRTFFDVRVFNPNASSYKSVQIPSLYKRQEQEKKRRYEERINNVELSSFTPIILACTGGCSKLTSIFLKRLASLLSEKHHTEYSTTINWLRCRLSFALLRACVMCLRGCRSKLHRTSRDFNILLEAAESRL